MSKINAYECPKGSEINIDMYVRMFSGDRVEGGLSSDEVRDEINELITKVRDQTLKESIDALEKEVPTAWFPNGALDLKRRWLQFSQNIIRSLNK